MAGYETLASLFLLLMWELIKGIWASCPSWAALVKMRREQLDRGESYRQKPFDDAAKLHLTHAGFEADFQVNSKNRVHVFGHTRISGSPSSLEWW